MIDSTTCKSWFVFILGICLLASFLSGCGLVIREAELWDGGPRFVFPEGLDFSIGANSVDNVENKRGVTPASAKLVKPQVSKY